MIMLGRCRSMLTCIFATLAMQSAAIRSRMEVSPVQKVMTLLGELEMKITKDAQEEDKAFEAYMEWCKNGAKDKAFEIKTAKGDIEDLEAQISKSVADLSTLSSKVDDLASAIGTNSADLKAAETVRDKEHKEFTGLEKELVDTVDTLKRAINMLERKLHGSALMQAKIDSKDVESIVRSLTVLVDAAGLSLQDRTKLLGLVQSSEEENDDEFVGAAPAPEAYKAHSKGIIDVLEDLKEKAELQLDQVRKEEVNARHNFDLMKQTLSDEIKTDDEDLSQTKALKHDVSSSKATAEGDLAETKKVLESAEDVLKGMDTDCAQKASDHEVSVKSRAEELQAVVKAKKILSESMEGASQLAYGVSFLQMANSGGSAGESHLHTRAQLVDFEVVTWVRKLAREQQSAELTQLASRISAAMQTSSGEDPFRKVKGMISDMIERLLKQAGEEAQFKAYCDKETAETKKKTAELQYDVEKLGSKIDKNTADLTNLKDEIATLERELLEIGKSQGEADALRKEEEQVYKKSKTDLQQGLDGVRLAMKLLRDYFVEKSSSAAELLQQPAAPETHSKSTGTGTSIISMLEVVESDFGKNLAVIEMNEETAATAYEKLSMKNRIDKAVKQKDVEYKKKEVTTKERIAGELSSDMDSTQTELDSVLESTKTIRGMCEVKPMTYEERAQRREQEISGLKEALRILEGESVFLQSQSRGHRRTQSTLRGAAVARHHK